MAEPQALGRTTEFPSEGVVLLDRVEHLPTGLER
jgi:hypothetical protein